MMIGSRAIQGMSSSGVSLDIPRQMQNQLSTGIRV